MGLGYSAAWPRDRCDRQLAIVPMALRAAPLIFATQRLSNPWTDDILAAGAEVVSIPERETAILHQEIGLDV